jgi:molybdopterin converting factor subunit 1
MKVKVLYFALARDLASKSAETFSLPDGASVGDVAIEVTKRHPALKALGSSAKFSLNLVVAERDAPLREGDEVGVLPPVAGG